jgi:hypothetical protein
MIPNVAKGGPNYSFKKMDKSHRDALQETTLEKLAVLINMSLPTKCTFIKKPI